MESSDVSRARAAVTSIAARCNLPADDATVIHNSNKLALRIRPCDVFARVAHEGREVAEFEVELAQGLAEEAGCPVAALEPRVAPRVYTEDGFAVTLWTYYGAQADRKVTPADYATALQGLHTGMRRVAVTAPHFTDRVAEALQVTSSPEGSPELAADDRELLSDMLGSLQRSIVERGAAEQLLHGEPHPGNLLGTKSGPVFIDLETCCHGPVEFDLAHVPAEVSDLYPNVDHALLADCRALVLAMVAAWRWEPGDEFPDGLRAGHRLLSALRAGPPWPALDVVMDD